MTQKDIRPWDGNSYTNSEGAELIKELDDRTKSDQGGYNSIDELATKVKALPEHAVVVTDSTVIKFDTLREYATAQIPENAVYTNDLTGARKGIVQKLYHASFVAPTFPAGWVKLNGSYTTGVLNIIYAVWAGDNRVEYWILKG